MVRQSLVMTIHTDSVLMIFKALSDILKNYHPLFNGLNEMGTWLKRFTKEVRTTHMTWVMNLHINCGIHIQVALHNLGTTRTEKGTNQKRSHKKFCLMVTMLMRCNFTSMTSL